MKFQDFKEIGIGSVVQNLKQKATKIQTSYQLSSGKSHGLTAKELELYNRLVHFTEQLNKYIEQLKKIGVKIQGPNIAFDSRNRQFVIDMDVSEIEKTFTPLIIKKQFLKEQAWGAFKTAISNKTLDPQEIQKGQIADLFSKIKKTLNIMRQYKFNVNVSPNNSTKKLQIRFDAGKNQETLSQAMVKVARANNQDPSNFMPDYNDPTKRSGWKTNDIIKAINQNKLSIGSLTTSELDLIINDLGDKKYKTNKMSEEEKVRVASSLVSGKINRSSGNRNTTSPEELLDLLKQGQIEVRRLGTSEKINLLKHFGQRPASADNDRELNDQIRKLIASDKKKQDISKKYKMEDRIGMNAKKLLSLVLNNQLAEKLTKVEYEKIYGSSNAGSGKKQSAVPPEDREKILETKPEMTRFAIEKAFLSIDVATTKELADFIISKNETPDAYSKMQLRNQAQKLLLGIWSKT